MVQGPDLTVLVCQTSVSDALDVRVVQVLLSPTLHRMFILDPDPGCRVPVTTKGPYEEDREE